MPWIAGTALLHSAVVMEKRNALKVWTILLAILTFSLSLIGTFLVRSGVLTSVHSFATDPTRGLVILALLAVFIGVGAGLGHLLDLGVEAGGDLHAYVTAPPLENKANIAVRDLIAKRFDVAKSEVTLVRGARSPSIIGRSGEMRSLSACV